jgi:hypothetical protein
LTKYPQYQVRDDTEELGTLSIVDEKGNTLFIRNRTCLGIHEDAYLMAASGQLAHALEQVWDTYVELVADKLGDDVTLHDHNALAEQVFSALNIAQGIS